jgi:hypothetical protein
LKAVNEPAGSLAGVEKLFDSEAWKGEFVESEGIETRTPVSISIRTANDRINRLHVA